MFYRHARFLGVAFCAVVLSGVACDDEKKLNTPTEPEPVKTGIPGTTRLDGLTPMQQQTLCTKSQEFLTVAFKGSDVQKALCKMTAVLAVSLGGAGGDPVSSCKMAQDECLSAAQAANAQPADAGAGGCDMAGVPLQNCPVTVADYESCLNGLPTGLKNAGNALPECAALGGADAGAAPVNLIALALAFPPSCIALQTQCGGTVPGLPTLGGR
ncbi:MAG: hypothetical protein SGI86_14275 [Deltaproteobacteria bacterium]|nr:hypothetical protein [Deltaproteobacteria bacterium]